jgi:hypothetical protein
MRFGDVREMLTSEGNAELETRIVTSGLKDNTFSPQMSADG